MMHWEGTDVTVVIYLSKMHSLNLMEEAGDNAKVRVIL